MTELEPQPKEQVEIKTLKIEASGMRDGVITIPEQKELIVPCDISSESLIAAIALEFNLSHVISYSILEENGKKPTYEALEERITILEKQILDLAICVTTITDILKKD